MSEAADGLMPEASLTANLNKDVFDVLLQNVRSTARKLSSVPMSVIVCMSDTSVLPIPTCCVFVAHGDGSAAPGGRAWGRECCCS